SSTNTLLSSQTAAPQPSETTRNKTRQKSEKTQTETVSNLEARHRRAAKENFTPKQKQTQTATPQPLKNKPSTACRERLFCTFLCLNEGSDNGKTRLCVTKLQY
ncbi:MAG: hypothetical protein IIY20_05150, partial [Bifidobacteriaceae bacterium]|nr:hypothetical protein [Bifidobacteriaceae bacterium]